MGPPKEAQHIVANRLPISATAEHLFSILIRAILKSLAILQYLGLRTFHRTEAKRTRFFARIFGRPFVKRFALCYQTVVCLSYPVCLSVCPVCDVGVLWPNGSMDENATWYGGRPRLRRHYVRWGPSSPSKGAQSLFSAHVCCGQRAEWIKMKLGTELGLGPGDIVLDGHPAPPKGAQPPNFWPMSMLAKRLDGSKMPLGTEVDPGPGHIVLDGHPAPPERGTAAPPCCWPMSIVPKRSPPKHLSILKYCNA